MNKETLFESMCGIDDAILERSEKNTAARRRLWKGLAGAAACFCVILAAAIAVPALFPGESPAPPVADAQATPAQSAPHEPIGSEGPDKPLRTWTVHYNDVTAMVDAAPLPVPGYFTEELNEAELTAVEPDRRTEWMEYSGSAGFDGEGTLLHVYLTVTTTLPDTNIVIAISESSLFRDDLFPDEPVISRCGDVEFAVYQYEIGIIGQVVLEADAKINDCYFSFETRTASASLEQAKEDFEQVLACFSYYPEDCPKLSAVTAESIPEWFDRNLTQTEALGDPDFGAYMPESIPASFTAESIRRYKDQNADYLSGLWTKGYDSLRWNVSYFSDSDAARLTSVADTENYDLSLYPIPRAESVPSELWEVVNNPIFDADELTLATVYARAYTVTDAGDTDGWRMNFSVKYGDILVEVNAKGVEPGWVYEQLIRLG